MGLDGISMGWDAYGMRWDEIMGWDWDWDGMGWKAAHSSL